MFTGIVKDVGKISRVIKTKKGERVLIESQKINPEIGASILVDGVCLTVEKSKRGFEVFISPETLKISKFKRYLRTGDRVNLEPSLKLGDELGGHWVTGHLDTTGKIQKIRKTGESFSFEISVHRNFKKYLYPKGAISVDGISLTIQDVKETIIYIAVIPYTYERTNFKYRRIGDLVNIEFDLFAKIVDNILKHRKD